MIDQFIASGEVKWGRICGLVLLLPHGYEGQGPEHSSARPERYLQLCAEHNMQVCVPTTPAQIFHLLRRQMLRSFRRPLIVMSPKSLLRHKEAVSSLEDLARGGFQNVIGEVEKIAAKNVRRIILCSGKVYYELAAHRREQKIGDVAIIRLEQQYPFPHADFKEQLAKFPNATEIVWCQEEPQNQGAWYRLRAYFRADASPKQIVAYAGRPVAATTAVGYMSKHLERQKQLIEDAFAPPPLVRGRNAGPNLTEGSPMQVEVKVPPVARVGGRGDARQLAQEAPAKPSRATRTWSTSRPTRSCSNCRRRLPACSSRFARATARRSPVRK